MLRPLHQLQNVRPAARDKREYGSMETFQLSHSLFRVSTWLGHMFRRHTVPHHVPAHFLLDPLPPSLPSFLAPSLPSFLPSQSTYASIPLRHYGCAWHYWLYNCRLRSRVRDRSLTRLYHPVCTFFPRAEALASFYHLHAEQDNNHKLQPFCAVTQLFW